MMKAKSNDIILQDRIFLFGALATGLVLSVPFIAMQFTNEVDWDFRDFFIIGILLFGMGSLFVLLARKFRKTSHRVIIGLAVAAAVFLIWAELAVGIFGTPFAGS